MAGFVLSADEHFCGTGVMTRLTIAEPGALDVLVVGVTRGPDGALPAAGERRAEAACGGRFRRLLEVLGATGAAEEITLIPADPESPVPLVVAVGLGTPIDAEALRRASGAAVRALAGRGRVGLDLVGDAAAAPEVQAVAEGALLGAYRFDEYRRPADRRPAVAEVVLLAPAELAPAADRGRVLADAVQLARDLVNTAPNDLYPATFAERALASARAAGVHGEVMDETALANGGYGGILAVGAGSNRPPRLVRLTWRPEGATGAVALVGKGITFDSGGLTLKSRDGLLDQKKDMVGAATVLAAVTAAARLNVPLAVTGYLAMAENMPGGSAYRPGDVLRMRNGLHVEVRNTDSEGRLVLADALARACEDSPDQVVCIAGLTGAQRIALGTRTCGVMGDEPLTDRLVAAGRLTGEPIWAMPLPEDIPPQLKSEIADLANWNPGTAGGMLRGASFLSRFVTPGTSWAHLDIAGPAFNGAAPRGYIPAGATGTPIRAVVALLEDLAAASG
jgi:leucyl aminopeptidase